MALHILYCIILYKYLNYLNIDMCMYVIYIYIHIYIYQVSGAGIGRE